MPLELVRGHEVLTFPAERFFIGSAPECGLRFPQLKPLHAEVRREPGGAWLIRDVSASGTVRIDGNPVTESVLTPGHVLSVEDVELIVRESTLETRSMKSGPAKKLEPGALIEGRYRIVRHLAQGGMGEVYEAEHIELHKPVAVKVMLPDLSGDPDFAARFKREAVAASRIGQFNIVDVSDFGRTTDGRFFFAMELLDGRTLTAHLREGRFEPKRAAHVAVQIGRALSAAHDRGIVHRDLKPENVMLLQRPGQPDFVKVLDFGIAKVVGAPTPVSVTQTGVVIGTPQYMSPEQAAGLPVDTRTDIYTLGLIVYELLAGRPPFTAATSSLLMSMQMTASPPPLPADVPAELAALVSQLLEKRIDDRPLTMHEVVKRLEPFTREAAAAPEAPRPRRDTQRDTKPRRIPRARSLLALFGGAFALAGVLGVAAAHFLDGREGPATTPVAVPAPKPSGPSRDADGFGCTRATLFAGDPLDEERGAVPADGAGLLDHPPLPLRTIAFSNGQLFTHTGRSLWRASLSDGKLHRIAGDDAAPPGLVTGPCAAARFATLLGLVVASDGALFVSDGLGNAVLKVVDPLGPSCRVLHWAGTPRDVPVGKLDPERPPNLGDADGPGLGAAKLSLPERLAIDAQDDVYLWEQSDSIRRVANDAQHSVTTLARKIGGGGGAANVSEVVLDGTLYVWGHRGDDVFLFGLDAQGRKTDVLRGDSTLFGESERHSRSIGGIATDGQALLVMFNRQLFRVSKTGALSPPLAGTGSHGLQFEKGYDPRAPHSAAEVDLAALPGWSGTTGTVSYLAVDAEKNVYVTAMMGSPYVTKLECGFAR